MAKLYPPIKPYKKGRLKVSGGHDLYYEMVGNPKGIPVVYLHGGPGAGISPNDRRYFNPRKFNVLLFDQRGAGKSKPFASIKNNTTWDLLDDINKLLDLAGFKKKVILFGGSWGSTLSLVYAINYPEKIKAMVLRGIFLSTREDYKDYFGGFSSKMFPDHWERFLSHVPKKNKKNPINYYIKQMNSKNKKIVKKYAHEWSLYEISMLKLVMTQKAIKKYLAKGTYLSLARLEAHYLSRNCFLPDKYILRNTGKIKQILSFIVHGRYDAICTPEGAYKLHKALPRSKLHFAIAGHSSGEEEIQKKLVEFMDSVGG